MNGYFWEMTASIIERKTDIISTNIYGGKVKTTEMIKIPEIKFFKCVWRGFSGGVAYIIMELPVIVILLNIIIFNKSEWVMILFAVQVMIWFLFPGLAWNYAKNNSVFSMLNIYTAAHLLENRPGRYLWNLLLTVITWAILLIIFGASEYILGFSANNEINNMQDVVKYTILSIIIYIPYIYAQYVLAFLTGTLGNSNDY